MLRLGFVSLLVAVLAACGMYAFKGEVHHLERELRQVKLAIEREHVEITRLRAEWATLSDPARLSRLAKAHLSLVDATPHQIARIDDVPLRSELKQRETPSLVSSVPHDAVAARTERNQGASRQ